MTPTKKTEDRVLCVVFSVAMVAKWIPSKTAALNENGPSERKSRNESNDDPFADVIKEIVDDVCGD